MRISKKLLTGTLLAALLSTNALAQKTRVAPVQAWFDDAYAWKMPDEGTGTMKLEGLKMVRVAFLTFLKFNDGTVPVNPSVITLMEGAPVQWAGPAGCTYELKLVSNPPSITMAKTSSMCAMRRGETAVFRMLAM